MPTEPPSPTDPEREADLGRVAVWLDPDDVLWLARELADESHLSRDDEERAARVRFRLTTALHKQGLPNNPSAS